MPDIKVIKLKDLKDFPRNAVIFSDSLSPESIEAFAEIVKDKKDELPPFLVSIRPDGTYVVDGHRRKKVGELLDWEDFPCIDLGVLSDDDIEDRILDCYEGTRDASPREKVAVYEAMRLKLQRAHGRTVGRPSVNSDNSVRINSDDVNKLAAKKAGLGSASTAKKLIKIFHEGDEELQEAVNSGSVSISKALKIHQAEEEPTPAEEPPTSEPTVDQADEPSVEPKEPVAEDPQVEEKPSVDQPPAILLRTLDETVALLLIAIQSSPHETNDIMRGVCLGLGMPWEEDDEEEAEEEDDDEQPDPFDDEDEVELEPEPDVELEPEPEIEIEPEVDFEAEERQRQLDRAKASATSDDISDDDLDDILG